MADGGVGPMLRPGRVRAFYDEATAHRAGMWVYAIAGHDPCSANWSRFDRGRLGKYKSRCSRQARSGQKQPKREIAYTRCLDPHRCRRQDHRFAGKAELGQRNQHGAHALTDTDPDTILPMCRKGIP